MQDAGLSRTRFETWSQTHQYNHQQLRENGEGSITLWETDAPEDLAGPRYQPGGRSSRYETCFLHETKAAYGNQRYTQQIYEQPFKPLPPSLSLVHRDIKPGKVLIGHSRVQPVEFGSGTQEWRRPCIFKSHPLANEADEIPMECNDSECRCLRRNSGVEVGPRIRTDASTSPAWPSLRGGADDSNETGPDGGEDKMEDGHKKTMTQRYAEELQAQLTKVSRQLKRLNVDMERKRFQRVISGASGRQPRLVTRRSQASTAAQQDYDSDESDPDDLYSLSPTATAMGRAALARRNAGQRGDIHRKETREPEDLEPFSRHADSQQAGPAQDEDPGTVGSQTMLTFLTYAVGTVGLQRQLKWRKNSWLSQQTPRARPSLRGGTDRDPDDDDSEYGRELDARIKKLVAALKRPSIKKRSARSGQTCAPESSKQGTSVHDGTISDGLKKLSPTTTTVKEKELAQQEMAQQGDGQQAESETQDTQAQQPGAKQADTHGGSNLTSRPSLRGGGNHDSDDDERNDEDPERDAKIKELAELLRLHNIGARRRRGSAIPDQKCVAGSLKQGAKMTTKSGQDDFDVDGSCERKKSAQQEESQEAETEHTQAEKPGPQQTETQQPRSQQTEIQEAETQQVEPTQDADAEGDSEEDDSSCYSDTDSFYGWSPVR